MSGAPRAVLDTNVVLSALLFAGRRLAWLRAAWQDGSVVPLLCRPTVEELVRALAYPKFALAAAERDELLADFLPYGEVVHLPKRGPRVPACRDPADRPFLVLARASGADALVTGDKDLLALAPGFAVPILTPDDFRARLAP